MSPLAREYWLYGSEGKSVCGKDDADGFRDCEIGFRDEGIDCTASSHKEEYCLYNQENLEDCIDL